MESPIPGPSSVGVLRKIIYRYPIGTVHWDRPVHYHTLETLDTFRPHLAPVFRDVDQPTICVTAICRSLRSRYRLQAGCKGESSRHLFGTSNDGLAHGRLVDISKRGSKLRSKGVQRLKGRVTDSELDMPIIRCPAYYPI